MVYHCLSWVSLFQWLCWDLLHFQTHPSAGGWVAAPRPDLAPRNALTTRKMRPKYMAGRALPGNLAIWQWKLAVSSDSYASYALFMVHVHCASYMFIKPWGTFHIPKLDCWREWFRWKIICWVRPTADQNWHCLVHHMGLSKRVCDHFDGWNMLKLWNGHFFRIWWP